MDEQYIPSVDDFLPEKWWAEDFTREKKIALLQHIEDCRAKRDGRISRDIVIEKLNGAFGEFRPDAPNKLFISEELLKDHKEEADRKYYSPFQAFHTVVHEGRHAFQYDVAHKILKPEYLLDGIADLWAKCFFYKAEDPDPITKDCKYYFDPTEEDANREALNELKSLSATFGDCGEFNDFINAREARYKDLEEQAAIKIGPDFRVKMVTIIYDYYYGDSKSEDTSTVEKKERKLPAFLDFGEPICETRKFSVPHLVMTGISVLLLIVMYLIARPHGFLRHVLWMTSSALAFLPMILLSWKKGLPKFLRNRFGGILMLAVYAVLLLLIQFIYKWLFVVYVIAGILFLLKTFNVISPNLLTIVREEADGTVTTEARVLGDDPDADIAAAERELKNEGYTIKK